jgi:hypothetical protein
MIRTLLRLFAPRPDPGQFVSRDCLRDALRAECAQGWEGPVWRTPKEVARLRRGERRQGSKLRMVTR